MTIYKNRYQANKDRESGEVVVKVCGGYVLMSARAYNEWRRQK